MVVVKTFSRELKNVEESFNNVSFVFLKSLVEEFKRRIEVFNYFLESSKLLENRFVL